MAVKSLKIAEDLSGALYYELPGSEATLETNATELEDPVFGQKFRSSEVALIDWSISGSAFFKGFPGYVAKVLKAGTPTTLAGETLEGIGTVFSGSTYTRFRAVTATKRVWDRNTVPTFVSTLSGPPALPAIVEIDYLHGEVEFATPIADAVDVVTGNYLPMTQLGVAQSFTLGMTSDSEGITDFATAQANGGYSVFSIRTLQVSLELSQFWNATDELLSSIAARSELVIELNPDGSGLSLARGYFKAITGSDTGDYGGVENETINYSLTVPQDYATAPFSWRHDPATTLSQAIQSILDAWANQLLVQVQYLPDGTNGKEGKAFVTDASMSGGVNEMNEFSVSLQGSGALANVP